MNCPNDNSELRMSERSGVEVDYCPQCRGVWLDRGELDKIIERTSDSLAPAVGGRGPQQKYDDRRDGDRRRYDDDRRRYDHDRRYDGEHGRGKPKKKKSSFLSELFEFGGE
jgi:uncharacterized protein